MRTPFNERSPGRQALGVIGGICFGIGVLGAGLGGGPMPPGPYAIWIVGLACLVASESSPTPKQTASKDEEELDRRSEKLATRADLLFRWRPDDCQWIVAGPPPPRKRHVCAGCIETIPEGARFLDIGEVDILDWYRGRFPFKFAFRSTMFCQACPHELVCEDWRAGTPA